MYGMAAPDGRLYADRAISMEAFQATVAGYADFTWKHLRAEENEPPVPVRTLAPEYPPIQKRLGVSGIVTVTCLIDEKGDVQEVTLEKPNNCKGLVLMILAVSRAGTRKIKTESRVWVTLTWLAKAGLLIDNCMSAIP